MSQPGDAWSFGYWDPLRSALTAASWTLHRLGAVRDADRIVVVSGGAVIEAGTHTELLAVGGTYAQLFERQAAGYREPSGAAR